MIRKIELKDAAKFIELNIKLANESDFLLPSKEECLKDLNKQESIISNMHENNMQMVFVSEENGDLNGFIGCTMFPLGKVKHIAKFGIGVLESAQGKGVAVNLILAMEDYLKERGIYRIEMTVISNNNKAIRFYEKMGYSKEGIRQKSIFLKNTYLDEIYMAKFI